MFQGRIIESEQVTAISIAFSEFDNFPSSIFDSTFGNISRIQFYGGKLKVIDNESFKLAAHLRFLEIKDTKIDEIFSKAFEGAGELTEMTLENCEIGIIAEDAFVGLSKLKKLSIKGSTFNNENFLNNLPKSVETIDKKILIE